MREPKPRSWWEEETLFIEQESRKRYPMQAFYSYCGMQAMFADRDGFPDLAARILTARKQEN